MRDGGSRWQADNGQYLLGLDVSVENGVLRVVERKEDKQEEDWFGKALMLEETDPPAAMKAYEQAAKADPDNVAAWIKWGRLLHEQGRMNDAEHVYRQGLTHCGSDAVLLFNLGVLHEDLGRSEAAIESYLAAISEDPNLADAHYNVARLYESLGRQQHAIRHLGQYRRLLAAQRP